MAIDRQTTDGERSRIHSRYRHVGRYKDREQELARGTEMDGRRGTVLEF
jgi:hypothetical protein